MWTMTKHHRTRVTFAFLVLLLSGGAVAGQADDWETGPLAEGGFEETLGGRLDAAFEDGRLAGLHGVVVFRQGKLRLERYYPGADERWGQTLGVVEHHAETRHDLRSVSVPTTAIESFLMKTSPSVTIELPDDVRFFRYPELSVQLRDALDDGPSVLVDALAVKSLDIVAMQIFVSAQKTARQKGKHLKILLASGGDADDDSPSVRQMVRMTPVLVFRALHTLKGSGAMFGYRNVAAFLHEFETAFESIRNGLTPVTAPLIDAALGGKDHVAELIADDDAERDGEPILAALRRAVGGTGAAPAPSRAARADMSEAGERSDRSWRISFKLPANALAVGADPLLILDELRELGDCEERRLTGPV
jgi:HPt (histidine-containing phosphotransfer) domain-containing protein